MREKPPSCVTATDIYKYIQCPHWPYYDHHATPAERKKERAATEGEVQRREDGIVHETVAIEKYAAEAGARMEEVAVKGDAEAVFARTIALMEAGTPLIYQGMLIFGDLRGRPDLLERRSGTSRFGDWMYVPIDVKSSHDLSKYQKLQLTFYALLLEAVQGVFPPEAVIINRDHVCLPLDPVETKIECKKVIRALTEEILGAVKPDPVLRKSCHDIGVWGRLCEADAEKNKDIALLYNVNVQKLHSLRTLGIRTVDEAAEMDPQAFVGAAPGLTLHGLETIKRQARSLKEESVLIRKAVELPMEGWEIHFDIESDPPNDVDYLYGFLIRRPDGSEEYLPFVAETLEQEGEMWRQFLAWLETLPMEYTVYHFGVYEVTRLRTLEERYGGSHWLDAFRERMTDLKPLTTSSVTFPIYFYGLKYIERFLGFRWRSEVKSGGQSVDAFERYLETGDRKILDAIILYNEDDVRATAHLKDWLARYAREITEYEPPFPWKKRRKSAE